MSLPLTDELYRWGETICGIYESSEEGKFNANSLRFTIRISVNKDQNSFYPRSTGKKGKPQSGAHQERRSVRSKQRSKRSGKYRGG